MKLVIVTGMSGAGKTVALKMMEDMGYYCVDNLPIPLMEKFAQLVLDGHEHSLVALGIDIRGGEDLSMLEESSTPGNRRPSHTKSFFWTPGTGC